MTHEIARALLPRYVVGALDLHTAAELRHHIAAGCGECRQVLFAARGFAPRRRARLVDRAARVAVAAGIAVAVVASVWTIAGGRDSAPRAPSLAPSAVHDGPDLAAKARRDAAPTEETAANAGGRNAEGAGEAAPPAVARDGDAAKETVAKAVPPEEERAADDTATSAVSRDATPAEVVPPPQETSAEPPTSLVTVRYARDVLSVHSENAPLGDVLREIGRQSGVKVHARIPDTRRVSVAFEDLPFEEALARLLGHNFLLTYEGARPRTLVVLETPQGASPATSKRPPSARATPPAESLGSVPGMRALRADAG